MSNPNHETLLKEFVFYSRLLKEHERAQKEKEISSTALQLHKNSSSMQTLFLTNNVDKNAGKQKPSFNQKYLCQNPVNSKRTVVFNQNQNFEAKYVLSKNQAPKFISTVTKSTSKNNLGNTNLLNVSKKSIVPSSFNGSQNPNSKAKEVLKEIESLTALLKRKNAAENQSRKLNSVKKCDSVAQGKLLNKKKSFDKPNFVDSKSMLLKAKHSKIIPEKNYISNSSGSKVKMMNSYSKVNPRNKISPLHPKTNIQSKYFYKKTDNKQALNVLSNSASLRVIKSAANQFPKTSPLPHSNKSIISDSKKLLNTSVNSSKSFGKQALIIKQSSANPSVSGASKSNAKSLLKAKSPGLLKFKASNLHKSPKVTKIKTANTRYTKINKHLNTPNKPFLLKSAVSHKAPLSRNLKGKLGNKYKVINKSQMQSVQKKKQNSLVCKDDPILSVDDPILKNSEHSAIDKLERNLMAISTALTASPFSEVNDGENKIQQNSISKASFKSSLKISSLKKSKTRISKYKIVNSNVFKNDLLRRKRKLTHLNSTSKKIKHSKFCLIKKKMQPTCITTPARKEKAVLVRRLFKSKNAIVNKNVTPVCNSAKSIKSKYLTLNKIKSPWMKQSPYPKVPPHLTKFKGYSLSAKFHAKRIGYQKAIVYTPRMSRKFTSYGSHALSGHFNKKIKTKKYIRNTNNRYAHHPVVLIHGMRYSMNASGKTLKKLPIKGQSTKLIRRINGKLPSSYESSFKMSTPSSTNLASRVLNRSINRILTASSKKKLTKVNTYCMFYNRFGRCNRGIKCTYIHDPSKIAVCTRFLRGTCKVDGCPFSHEVAPGKMAICSLFLIGVCEKENCPYRHEKLSHDAVLCKAFVQGYCPNGKECKKAHILICPKYMQGECDKGSSCDFPHPPQKARKTLQKDVDDEERKMDDVLLEKVFRYFQQSDSSSSNPENKFDDNNTVNMFVPKQKKLEEQPSFIPLCTTPEI